jgi:hypothetical protein
MQPGRKHKEMRRNTKTLNRKDKKSYLPNITDFTTLPLGAKKFLNWTIMHLSTTTKNKLQRIKYNKVGNKNQLGTLSKFLPKFEFKYEVIPNSISSTRKPTPLDQD